MNVWRGTFIDCRAQDIALRPNPFAVGTKLKRDFRNVVVLHEDSCGACSRDRDILRASDPEDQLAISFDSDVRLRREREFRGARPRRERSHSIWPPRVEQTTGLPGHDFPVPANIHADRHFRTRVPCPCQDEDRVAPFRYRLGLGLERRYDYLGVIAGSGRMRIGQHGNQRRCQKHDGKGSLQKALERLRDRLAEARHLALDPQGHDAASGWV